jgi:hypothetical protein
VVATKRSGIELPKCNPTETHSKTSPTQLQGFLGPASDLAFLFARWLFRKCYEVAIPCKREGLRHRRNLNMCLASGFGVARLPCCPSNLAVAFRNATTCLARFCMCKDGRRRGPHGPRLCDPPSIPWEVPLGTQECPKFSDESRGEPWALHAPRGDPMGTSVHSAVPKLLRGASLHSGCPEVTRGVSRRPRGPPGNPRVPRGDPRVPHGIRGTPKYPVVLRETRGTPRYLVMPRGCSSVHSGVLRGSLGTRGTTRYL